MRHVRFPDVRDKVPERIDPYDLSFHGTLAPCDRGPRLPHHEPMGAPQAVERNTRSKVRSNRCHDVSTMERRGDRRAPERRLVEPDCRHMLVAGAHKDLIEQSIVGCHEIRRADSSRHDRAIGSDTGIDHGNVNRPGRKEGCRVIPDDRPLANRLGTNRMRYINHHHRPMETPHHALHLCDIGTPFAEVGHQRDHRRHANHSGRSSNTLMAPSRFW